MSEVVKLDAETLAYNSLIESEVNEFMKSIDLSQFNPETTEDQIKAVLIGIRRGVPENILVANLKFQRAADLYSNLITIYTEKTTKVVAETEA